MFWAYHFYKFEVGSVHFSFLVISFLCAVLIVSDSYIFIDNLIKWSRCDRYHGYFRWSAIDRQVQFCIVYCYRYYNAVPLFRDSCGFSV